MDWSAELTQILSRAEALKFRDDKERSDIVKTLVMVSSNLFGSDEYGKQAKSIVFYQGVFTSDQYDQYSWEFGRNELCELIRTIIKSYDMRIKKEEHVLSKSNSDSKNIFVVHGHNEELKLKVSYWLYSIGLNPIILHYQPNMGIKSIIDKIRQYSDVNAAVILFSSDDLGRCKTETKELEERARQNVVFEAGYFIGKLGADRVIMISEPNVTIPSDLSGCIYISTQENWEEKIRVEFKSMGINLA